MKSVKDLIGSPYLYPESAKTMPDMFGIYSSWFRMPWLRFPPSYDKIFNGSRDYTTKIPLLVWRTLIEAMCKELPIKARPAIQTGRSPGKSISATQLLKLSMSIPKSADAVKEIARRNRMVDRVVNNLSLLTSHRLREFWTFSRSNKSTIFEQIEAITRRTPNRVGKRSFTYFPESDTAKGVRPYHVGHRPSQLAFHIGRQQHLEK